MGYIRVPIETNPEILGQDIYDYIQSQQPGWTPADGNLDVWIIRALAAKAAENRTLASDVPDDIFASFGSSLMSIPPTDAVAATGDTTWTLIDSLGHTIPEGTYLGLRNGNGDLVTFRTLADVIVAPGDSVTAVGEVAIQATEAGTDANTLSGTPELIDVIDWVASIALVAPTSGGVDAETFDDYLTKLSRKLQALSTVPVLPPDFARAAEDADPGVFRAVAIDLYNPLHNLLTTNEADIETDASGWVNLANSVVTQSATASNNGTKSLRLASIAGGDMNAILNREVPVAPGEKITVIASEETAVSVRSVKVGIRWIDAAHANIGTIVYGAAANDSAGAFTLYSVTAIAPSNAAYMKIVLFVTATGGATELHYFDTISIRHGSGTDWVQGDTPETDNIKTITIAAVDSAGNDVSGTIKTNIINYINARRETNWVTHVMSPNYTQMDAEATVAVLSGFDPTSVETAVIAAITNYFEPYNWGIDPAAAAADATTTWIDQLTVYYNEVIALVSNIDGVSRVVDLTINIDGNAPGRVDVPLNGPAALTTVGTITAVTV